MFQWNYWIYSGFPSKKGVHSITPLTLWNIIEHLCFIGCLRRIGEKCSLEWSVRNWAAGVLLRPPVAGQYCRCVDSTEREKIPFRLERERESWGAEMSQRLWSEACSAPKHCCAIRSWRSSWNQTAQNKKGYFLVENIYCHTDFLTYFSGKKITHTFWHHKSFRCGWRSCVTFHLASATSSVAYNWWDVEFDSK